MKQNELAYLLYPGVLLLLLLSACKEDQYVQIEESKLITEHATFSGTETCISCHQEEYEEWEGSHHDLAMKAADSVTVLGDFNDAVFESKGVTYKFFTKDDGYYVNTEGVGGEYADYRIEYTFGVYPLQQYIVKFPDGKYQCLISAWDSEENKWFDLQPDLNIHHTEWLHWTRGSQTWNKTCADCHSTDLRKNYDPESGKYNTTYSIINVSCEACHGPSSEHVTFYSDPKRYESGETPPELYMGNTEMPQDLVQKCARCHARRGQLTGYFDYEGDFLDHYKPQLLISPLYELDGQIRDEVYVYGSFVQSKMYQQGVSCRDCHNMHSLELKRTGNNLCMNCHTPDYNSEAHHFHRPDTEAALCVNCHMTGKIYMGNDFRRDHSFRVPRPDQTVEYGTPNACNQCHTDKTAEWAAEEVRKRFGDTRPEHFSDDLLAGYHNDLQAFYRVFSNTAYPELVRATALNQFGNQPLTPREVDMVKDFINDQSALVRSEAALALSKTNNDLSKLLEPLLMDSVRLVRTSAARYFNSVDPEILNTEKYAGVNREYLDEMKVNADYAGGQHQIALHYQARGNKAKAMEAYYRALEIDNYYNMSRMNLALMEYQQGNTEKAEELYHKVVEQQPENSYPYYMLGLLYNEKNMPEEALKFLALSCEKEPGIPRAFYNYALKLQEGGDFKRSVEILDKGLAQFPDDEGLLYVKLIGLINLNDKQNANGVLTKLLQLSPGNPNYLNIQRNLNM